ncbi:uncharacterized protein C2845_PM03G18270 [Panicum miliaceum]|uniref:Retrotransposon gag domain-containing protein n=1 Tax=Panicum miliaceum TaxID=4540 RepID=A0A3L6TB70_PANMI|nr:uncharacterized protein C2845_PM03G18270 [Panicum miliaceum]
MSTAEEKLDRLLTEVKALKSGQLKLVTTVDTFNTRSVNSDKLATELSDSVKNLTSRIEALETATTTAPPQAPPREEEGRANGHRVVPHYQGADGKNSFLHHTLVKGESPTHKLHTALVDEPESSDRKHGTYHQHHREYKSPKIDFPKFNGEHPKIWKENCEKYFAMYSVPTHLWAPFATINFTSTAALWLQSYEAQHNIENWPELCVAVDQKFGRDLYQNHMRDLLAIKQSTTVLEYAERFEQAKHRVLVHNQHIDDVFFVQKFIDGLRYNISTAITLHKPRTVDAALSLALMQEDLLEASSKRYHTKHSRDIIKFSPRPSTAGSAGVLGATPQETVTIATPRSVTKPKWDDKLATLRAQRRAQGLCMKCGAKWGRNHKCPPQIPLQVLEEFLDATNIDDVEEEEPEQEELSSEEEVLSLSLSATEGIQGKKTIKLQGLIHNQEVLILVDSGSFSTFINTQTAAKLQYQLQGTQEVQVTMANGNVLKSNKMIADVTWWTQGHTFTTNARVLDIKCYDIVLGMDWLEQHSPMWIDWKRKKMRFNHKEQRITLTGVKDCLSKCTKLEGKKLRGLLRKGRVAQLVQLSAMQPSPLQPQEAKLPDPIQHLLQEHDNLFKEPTDLPPHRSLDHKIDLIPGVQQMNVKPYRYAPTQKDEIERQVKEMLLNGII